MSGFKKATKQLDKFGQQLGERLNLQQSKRTDLSDTFRDLEGSVELRRLGTERLAISSRDYLKGFKKEKIQDGSVLPIELLGLNQLTYGTDLGESDYAASLVSLGRAHCKIGAITESFVEEVTSGFQAGIERSVESMKEYHSMRKKLESRRLTMDSTIKKRDASKKGDNSKLEEEVRIAVARFEEAQEDVEMRMEKISNSDAAHHQELFYFLEAELNMVDQIREELLRVKSGWVQSQEPPSRTTPTRSRIAPPSMRRSGSSYKNSELEPEEEDESFTANRARSNSAKSAGGSPDKEKKSIFGSLAGRKKSGRPRGNTWGSLNDNQEGAITTSDAYSFAEDPDARPPSGLRTRSASSATTFASAMSSSSSASPRTTPPVLPRRSTISAPEPEPEPDLGQYVKATFDFHPTAPDELLLIKGDVVRVTEEISGDWYIGQKSDGSSGLFPSSYTAPTSPPTPVRSRPQLPVRPNSNSSTSNAFPFRSNHSSSNNTPTTNQFASASTTSFSSELSNGTLDHHDPYGTTSEGSEDERFNDKVNLTSAGASSLVGGGSSRHGGGNFGSAKKAPPPPPPTSRRATITRRNDDYQDDDDVNPFS